MHIDDGALVGAVIGSISTLFGESGDAPKDDKGSGGKGVINTKLGGGEDPGAGDDAEITPGGDSPAIKAYVITIVDTDETPTLAYNNYKFIQTEELTALGVAVHPYGAIIVPDYAAEAVDNEQVIVEFGGEQYGVPLGALLQMSIGETVPFELIEDEGGGGGDNAD